MEFVWICRVARAIARTAPATSLGRTCLTTSALFRATIWRTAKEARAARQARGGRPRPGDVTLRRGASEELVGPVIEVCKPDGARVNAYLLDRSDTCLT